MPTIVERIDAAIEMFGLTPAQLCRLARVDKGAYHKWRAGSAPGSAVLAALRDQLGLSGDWLLGDEHADWVSPRVRHAFAELRTRLADSDQWRNSNPSERLRYCLDQLRPVYPELTAPYLLCFGMGIPENVLIDLSAGTVDATEYHLDRFAALTGISRDWLETGNPRYLEGPDVGRWVRAIRSLEQAGVKPETVERGAGLISQIESMLKTQ